MAIKLAKEADKAMKGMGDWEKWYGVWQYKRWKIRILRSAGGYSKYEILEVEQNYPHVSPLLRWWEVLILTRGEELAESYDLGG